MTDADDIGSWPLRALASCPCDRPISLTKQRGVVLGNPNVGKMTMPNMRPNARHGFQSPARTKAVRLNAWAGFSAAPAGAT
jgi:hypothetical protein